MRIILSFFHPRRSTSQTWTKWISLDQWEAAAVGLRKKVTTLSLEGDSEGDFSSGFWQLLSESWKGQETYKQARMLTVLEDAI